MSRWYVDPVHRPFSPPPLGSLAIEFILERSGRLSEPLIGRSLVPLVEGRADRVYGPNEAIGYEFGENAALFQGDYKIVLNRDPVGDGDWHLYDIEKDPRETTDLAAALPHRLHQMLSNHHEYARLNGVLLVPKSFDAQRQVAINGLRARGLHAAHWSSIDHDLASLLFVWSAAKVLI
jgi:hypothetical protein